MSETLALMLALGAGGALGAVFFGGLWWTIRKGVASQRPALWFVGSFLVRVSLTLVGFFFVSGGNWKRLAACLAGFLLARLIVTWLTRTPKADRNAPVLEVHHAPRA